MLKITNLEGCRKMDCVDSVAALHLLLLRPTKETKPVSVNIFCEITAVSEIIQIKDAQLFLVKILPKLNIICKRKESLHLHKRITPGTPVIFTNLRHTTLQKGSSFTKAMYSVTKETEVFTEKDVEVRMLTLEEWLKEHGFKYVVDVPDLVEKSNPFSYTGTITNILDTRLGVYEMDSENRLFLGQVPAIHKYRHLTVGMKISIHNVHPSSSTQYTKLSMYGCMLTSVKVLHQEDCTKKKKSRPTPQLLKNYLYLYQLSHRKLEHLFHICHTVHENFSYLGNGFCDDLIKGILGTEKLAWVQNTSNNYRNHLDEFLLYPHQCSITHGNDKTFPSFVSIKQFLNGCTVEQNKEQSWNYTYRPGDSDQIFLGTIDICEKTGLSVFKDFTEQINMVITDYLGSNSALDKQDVDRHACNSDCDCGNLKPGQCFTCPYLHTCCVGKIVAITKYGLITEYVTKTKSRFDDGNGTTDLRNYLVLSLKDAVYLGSVKKDCFKLKSDNRNVQCNLVRGDKCLKNSLSNRENQENIFGEVSCDTCTENNELSLNSKDKEQTKVNIDNTTTGSAPTNMVCGPALHRHQRHDGGWYFCRKDGCTDGAENVGQMSKYSQSVIQQNKTYNKKQSPNSGSNLFGLKPLNHNDESISIKKTGDVFDIPVKKRRTRNYTERESVAVSSNYHENENCEVENPRTSGNEEFSDASWENSCETGIVIIHRKDALAMDRIGGNQCARFCVHGQIIQDTLASQAVLLFKGKAAKWYSVIRQGSIYRFSVCTELCPLFQHNVGNVKVMQKLKKDDSKVFMVVNESAELEQIYHSQLSMIEGFSDDNFTSFVPKDSPSSVFSGVFKDVEGTILSRTYIQGDNLHEKSGRPGILCTRIKLKTADNEILQIYLKAGEFISPLGLVPGSVVYFTRLERKVSQLGNIYWRFIPLSSVRVIAFTGTQSNIMLLCSPDYHAVAVCSSALTKPWMVSCYQHYVPWTWMLEMVQILRSDQVFDTDCLSTVQTHFLRDVWEHTIGNQSEMFMCVCSVQQILKVSLKYVCDHCGSMIRKSTCSNAGCFKTDLGRFIARASILVDDGTSVAIVTMMGDMVRELLGLSINQWEEIQMEVNIQGELFVQQARPELQSGMERFIYQLCDSRLVKHNWTMKLKTKPVGKYTDLDQMKTEEFGQKTFDTGTNNKITTRCLPFLQLECLHLQTIDTYQLCLNLLTI